MEAKLDIRLSARENAAAHFDRAKKLKEKLERSKALLESLEKGSGKKGPLESKGVKKRKPEWYEGKFRFFFSSDGNLVLAGKDATTNELLIKKHLSKGDTVFHADPSGSPFVVIRGKASEKTLLEASVFCASYSRAWQARLASIDVYSVSPEQVSKTAPPGEYLAKGSFMINGKKNYFKNTVLGLVLFQREGRMFSEPDVSGRERFGKFVRVAPGHRDRTQVAQEIRQELQFQGRVDEIDTLLPPGKCEIRRD